MYLSTILQKKVISLNYILAKRTTRQVQCFKFCIIYTNQRNVLHYFIGLLNLLSQKVLSLPLFLTKNTLMFDACVTSNIFYDSQLYDKLWERIERATYTVLGLGFGLGSIRIDFILVL